ncbi:hypothetical protein L7F22_029442 [Adiantum nelumboides]|nr:hypothetical protein [Adiantum nelumboides]
MHISHAAHVGDEHQVEVGVAVHGEVDAPGLGTGHPPVVHWHNAAPVAPNLLKRWLRHVEVLQWGIAPATSTVGQRVVGRTEIGGRHHHRGASNAPLWVCRSIALDLEASTAAQPGIEEGRAQGRRVCAVAGGVEVAIPARPPCRRSSHKL